MGVSIVSILPQGSPPADKPHLGRRSPPIAPESTEHAAGGRYNPPGDPETMCLAAPARVIEVKGNEVLVDYNGVRTSARLDALPDEVSPGDYVLIHTGFAIRRLSPEDGEETLRLFDELATSLAAESPGQPGGEEPDASGTS